MTSCFDIARIARRAVARTLRAVAFGAVGFAVATVAIPRQSIAQTPSPIAAVQENAATLVGTSVTVEGQIYIPTNYRGTTISGFMQDSSGRGINLFGSSANTPTLQTIGNRVRVTGEVAIFSTTTVEILNITAITSLGSGARDVPPVQLSTGAAANARWEGTFIESRGMISATSITGGATNYTINDGTGVLVVRVINILGAPSFTAGQSILARGAGSKFGTDFQILVGTATDIVLDPGGADTTPPVLAGAWANTGTQVRATFNEAVNAISGAVATNYVAHDVGMNIDVAIMTATVSGPVVDLVLASSLRDLAAYELRATSVADLAGNPITTTTVVGFTNTNVADTTPPTLVSATSPSLSSVAVVFNEPVEAASGGAAANYEVFVTSTPATTVPVSSASVAGTTVTLSLGSMLTASTNYTVRVQNVADLAGNLMVGMQTATFTVAGGPTVTPIATIQANPAAFVGMSVTVQGQVYVPANYRGTTTYSGYIQDGSGRGINLFGTSANNMLLFDRGNIVQVTGTVAIFSNTTVELTPLTNVTLVSSGNPPLTPAVLTTGAAASAAWEGTFIETVGTISAKASTAGSSPAVNYTVNDGSGNVLIRVLNIFGVAEFNVGERIRGRGAGAQFSPDFQILVGRGPDVFVDTGGPDITPPTLTSASAPNLASVQGVFSESVDATTGGNVANYSIYETANMANTAAIASASVTGATVTLTLATNLTAGTNYTLRAENVQDLAGNAMTAPGTRTFTPSTGPATTPIATIQANPAAFVGMSVTVQGQVYVPANYRGTTTYSGYIQDGSGRGINLFGSSANNMLLFDRGNIVRVTGTVAIFSNTTVELTPLTDVTLVSSSNPPLTPTVLTTGAAASAAWEGTFIETVGTISAKASTAGSSPAVNYTVNDGSGNVLIRVLDIFGVAQFNVGERIRGRGAGAQFSPDFQILVGRGSDVFVDTGGPDTTPPTATNATAPTATSVAVTFSEAVTAASGGAASNYAVFETANTAATVAVTGVTLAGDRRSATLALGASLVDARSYTVRVSNLQDDAGNTQTTPQTRSFTRGGGPVITPIATIQASPTTFEGMMVTVEGQVYIPSNYRGTTISGYIQDGSGRGINLFGSTANVAALQNTGNIVRLTGTVTIFNTIIELASLSGITVLSSGNPPLVPAVLRTGDAAGREWEGTYILTSGPILAKTTSGGAFNYTVDDGSGPVVIRVVSTINATEFNVGQTITARGAGSQFNADFQILVGAAAAISEGTPIDVFPPSIVRASATGAREVTVTFNEAVASASGGDSGNYEIFRTNATGETIGVTSATVGGTSVRLTLDGNLDVSRGYTVRVRNVADMLGNAISAAGVTRVIEETLAETVTLSGPPFTFLPRQGEAYPITFTVPSDVAGNDGEVLLRIFDVQGRLLRTLFDSRFDTGAFTNNRAVRAWDGRDDFGQIVPAGTYVAHLHVVGNQSGEAKRTTIPVVVATRLDR